MINDYVNLTPGIQDTLESVEGVVVWGPRLHQLAIPITIDSATVDAGNTPTTILRPGLILGRVTATGKYKQWAPLGTDGTQIPVCILLNSINMLMGGTATQRLYWGLVKGNLRADGILIPGESTKGLNGKDAELRIRAYLNGQFIFDDEPWGAFRGIAGGWRMRVLESADLTGGAYTMSEADNNTWFVVQTGAATTLTLPNLAGLLRYGFACRITNIQDEDLILAAPGSEDSIIAYNEVAADTITFGTTGEQIGATLEVAGIHDGSAAKYLVVPNLWKGIAAGTQAATIA